MNYMLYTYSICKIKTPALDSLLSKKPRKVILFAFKNTDTLPRVR